MRRSHHFPRFVRRSAMGEGLKRAFAAAKATRKPRVPKDPNKVTFKTAEPELRPCLCVGSDGRERRFRVEGSCSVVLGGRLAVHPTPAISPSLVGPDALVPGVRGWYSVTHIPTGLCVRPAIEGAVLVRAYVKALARAISEAGHDWGCFSSEASRPSFRRFDDEAFRTAQSEVSAAAAAKAARAASTPL